MIATIGAANVDRRGILLGPTVLGTSNPGDVYLDFGGVARNVAENLARLGCAVTMVSRVGDDEDGRRIIAQLESAGIESTLVSRSPTRRTASYTAIMESNGELVIGLDDMDICEEIEASILQAALPRLQVERHWFIDTNVPGAAIGCLLSVAGRPQCLRDAVSVFRAPPAAPAAAGNLRLVR